MTINERRVKIIGGFSSSEEKTDAKTGKSIKGPSTFSSKKEFVILEKDIGAFFRREFEFCSKYSVRIQDTHERVTPGYVFSNLPFFKV